MATKRDRKLERERREAEIRLDKKEREGLAWQQKERDKINEIIKEQAQIKRESLSIEESINNIQDSILGKLKEKFGLESDIAAIKKGQESDDAKTREGAKKYAQLLEGVASGAVDLDGVLAAIAMEGATGVENFGPFLELVEKLAENMEKIPDL